MNAAHLTRSSIPVSASFVAFALVIQVFFFWALRAFASTPSKQVATPSECDSSIICPGEDLTHEVSWLGIGRGQIRLQTPDSQMSEGYSAYATVDSYR